MYSSYSMNNTWEYTWTPDDVRRRHEFRYDKQGNLMIDTESLPIYYPIWSDRQWKAVWHAHNKYLRDKKRIADQDKREGDIRTQNLKYSLQWIVAYLISDVARRKDEKHKQVQEERDQMRSTAVLRSGDQKKAMWQIDVHKEKFNLFSTEQLIYLWVVLEGIKKDKNMPKKWKANAAKIQEIVTEIMWEKWLSVDTEVIMLEFKSLSQETIKECCKLFAKGISRY